MVDTLLDERFDKNVGAGKALCAAGSGTVILGGGHGFGLDQFVALERPDSTESACQPAIPFANTCAAKLGPV